MIVYAKIEFCGGGGGGGVGGGLAGQQSILCDSKIKNCDRCKIRKYFGS